MIVPSKLEEKNKKMLSFITVGAIWKERSNDFEYKFSFTTYTI